MHLIDTHAHLDDEQFDENRADVVGRALDAGVTTILAVGTTAESSAKVVAISQQFPSVFAAVGIQPNYCAEAQPQDWQRIAELAGHPRAIAIGETGLDRYWDYTPFDVQQDYFSRHVQLSRRSGLPFIVHMRDCGEEIVEQLEAERNGELLNGVMHSFTGDTSLADRCLAMGLYISFAGMVTYKKSDELRQVAAAIPDDRLLIETDSPYLSPHPKRGQRPNEPALVVHTAACLAETRGVTIEKIAEATTANARRLFKF